MNINIAVLGVGAIGSSIGADLTKSGYNVMLIDQWPAHVEVMNAQGLHVTIQEKELHTTVQAFHLCEVCTVQPQLDIIFLAPKSYDTHWMVEFIKPYLKPDGVLVSTQNSLNEEWITPIIGCERGIGCTLELGAEIFEPGLVKRNTDHATTKFVLGELDGSTTPRLEKVAQILSVVGKTGITTNIWGAKWTKLLSNTMVFGLDVILGMRPWQILESPKCLGLCIKLARETAQVASAVGCTLEPIFGLTAEDFLGLTDKAFEKLAVTVATDVGKEQRTVIMQDLAKGRPTEIDYLSGLVVKKGREVMVATPLNQAVVSLVKKMEQGELKPSLSNLTIIQQYAESNRTGS